MSGVLQPPMNGERMPKRAAVASECTHHAFRYEWGCVAGTEVAIAKWCLACGERSPLGAANEDDGAGRVAIEVRAATVDYDDSVLWTDDELRGWDMHGADDDAHPANDGEECGYLARELATHDDRDDRDADAWPWNIARPIAEQQPVPIEIVVRSETKDVHSSVVETEDADGDGERALDSDLNDGGAP